MNPPVTYHMSERYYLPPNMRFRILVCGTLVKGTNCLSVDLPDLGLLLTYSPLCLVPASALATAIPYTTAFMASTAVCSIA